MSFQTFESKFIAEVISFKNEILTIAPEVEEDAQKAEIIFTNIINFIAKNNNIENADAVKIATFLASMKSTFPQLQIAFQLLITITGGIQAAINWITANQSMLDSEALIILNYITGTINKLPASKIA